MVTGGNLLTSWRVSDPVRFKYYHYDYYGSFDHIYFIIYLTDAGVICFQFFIGWWIIIDAAAGWPSEADLPHACHTCGVIGTLALIMYVTIVKYACI